MMKSKMIEAASSPLHALLEDRSEKMILVAETAIEIKRRRWV